MMALVHDLAEAQGVSLPVKEWSCPLCCLVGDIAPREGIPKELKHQLEAEAMQNFTKVMLHDSPAAQRISALWQVSLFT